MLKANSKKKPVKEQTVVLPGDRNLRQRIVHELRNNWVMWIMILPVIFYVCIFSYAPMPGIILAFKNFNYRDGIFGSPWVGFKHFQSFFDSFYFERLIGNTLTISLAGLLFAFPIAIIFALLISLLRLRQPVFTVLIPVVFVSIA